MTNFINITTPTGFSKRTVNLYCTGLYRMSDGWFIAFYQRTVTPYYYEAVISSDGETWSFYGQFAPGTGIQERQLYILQEGDNLFLSSSISTVDGSGWTDNKLIYNGNGSWTRVTLTGGEYNYRAQNIITSFCNKSGYPFVSTQQTSSSVVRTHFINEAFDNHIELPAMSINATAQPTAKAFFSIGNEIRLVMVYTDISGTKARYFTTSNYIWPVASGEIFCNNPLVGIHSLASYQENANSDAYVLLATASGLYAYDKNLQNPRRITTMLVESIKIGKIGNRIYCVFRNSQNPYGFYQCVHYKGTIWGNPIFIDGTNDENYIDPQIVNNTFGSSLFFYFTNTSSAIDYLVLGSLVPWVPPWIDLAGDYIESPCGYAGQVISDAIDVSHLNDQVVSIYANGEVLEQQVVVDGTVNVSSEYSLIHIGLPFYSDLETLNIEVPLQEGTMQSKREKISNVTFSFNDTRGGFIGPNEFDLWEAFSVKSVRQSSGKNIKDDELFTGDVRQPLVGQYENDGSVFFRQVDPLPVTIGAIIPEVDLGNASR